MQNISENVFFFPSDWREEESVKSGDVSKLVYFFIAQVSIDLHLNKHDHHGECL
jgi:hypothetical protein